MESSAPKRRRTSPQTSVPVDNNGNVQSTTPPDPPATASSARPSFASPTKASLARHNPAILERRRSVPETEQAGASSAPSASRPTSRSSIESLTDLLNAQLNQQAQEASADTDNAPNPRQQGGIVGGEYSSTAADHLLRSPTRKLGGGMASRPKRTPVKPIPRPLPPPGPQQDEDIMNPFKGNALRRSGIGVLGDEDVPEPELPPTPEHPDPEIITPPSGIHESPSKRARRNKALAQKLRNSPLKQPPLRPPSPVKQRPPGKFAEAPDAGQDNDTRPVRRTSDVRGVKPFDPDAEKKKERDALLAQIAQLEADLEIATRETERIRQARESGQEPSAPDNLGELLGVVCRNALPRAKPRPDPDSDWLQAALNPTIFLPFSKPSSSLPTLFKERPREDEPLPFSYHPAKMGAEEELPFLQAFTPLTFSSNIVVLPSDVPNAPLLQKHYISVASARPKGIFAARVEMTVDTKSLTVTDLSVPRLDPAAAPELNPFFERIVRPDACDALRRNVCILTWAMGAWVRVAVRRAKFWVLLERQLGNKEALVQTLSHIRARGKKRKHTRGRARDDADDSDGGDRNDGAPKKDGTDKAVAVPRVELLGHLGRTAMDIDVPSLAENEDAGKLGVRVQWRIEFDWTGEAQSRIGILVGVPGKWRKADDRGSLAGISELFDKLIQGHEDPADAVKTVVALLAGDITP